MVIDWIREQLIVLHKSMPGVTSSLNWTYAKSFIYLAEVCPLNAVLGLIGRWWCRPQMPKTERDITGHMGILQQLRRILLKELYPEFPARVPRLEEASPETGHLRRPGVCPGPEAKGRSRLFKTPPRVPSR